MDNINKELLQIAKNDSSIVKFGYAKKIVNNLVTEEKCLSFGVKKKLPLAEISSNKLIPSEIEIDGVVYKTDVTEIVDLQYLACSLPAECYSCYDPVNAIPCATNYTGARPIKGGTPLQLYPGYGTLGFFAVHTPTQAIVGVTNAHVADIGSYYNTYTAPAWYITATTPYSFTNRIPLLVPNSSTYNIYGGVRFGLPIHINKSAPIPFIETIDAAIIGVYQTDAQSQPFVTNAESWKQIGLSDIPGGINTPPTFASTQELDALIDFTNLEVWSSGARTGPKKGVCGLTILSTTDWCFIDVSNAIIAYKNQITISRSDVTCQAIDSGDSGSALMGKVPTYNPADPNWKNGPRTWKILGLVYAGSVGGTESYGVVCRIDEIATKLQIEAWDGSPKSFIDINNLDYKTFTGPVFENPKTIDGKTYWQLGAFNTSPAIF